MFAHIEIDHTRCKGCGLCTIACPRMLLKLDDVSTSIEHTPAVIVSQEKCVGCALCAGMCPDMAISVFSRQKNEFTGSLSASYAVYARLLAEKASGTKANISASFQKPLL